MQPEIIGIEASAGSGKTYQLSLRYLKLLSKLRFPSKENLRKIVAITFTNKAAAEMKDRILVFLKEIAFNTPFGKQLSKDTKLSSKVATEWVEVILLNYSDFHVRTIDSLLFAILKGLSFELGIKTDSDVLFDREPVLEKAFDVLVSSLMDERTLWEEVVSTYLKIDGKDGFYPEAGLKWRLFNLYPKIEDHIQKKEVDISYLERAERELQLAYIDFYNVYESLKRFLNKRRIRNLSKELPLKEIIKKPFLNKEPSELFLKSASVSKRKFDNFCRVFNSLKQKANNYREFVENHLPFARVNGYVLFLQKMQAIVEYICKREGIILGGDEWTDLVMENIKKDGVPPLVYAHFAVKFSHFLFDEFQDTSRSQWNGLYYLLEDVLSEGGTLFLVGDTKQAIFRWRGGDWSIFNELFEDRSYFPSVENRKKKILEYNYRSHPKLVEFFNSMFNALADRDFVRNSLAPLALGSKAPDGIKEKFTKEVVSAFSNSSQRPKVTTKSNSLIKIYEVFGTKEENSLLIKNQLIEDVKKEWEKRKENSGETPIAVLVRTHGQGEEVSSWLLSDSIPVVTENGLKLKISRVVKGILCFLSYLYNSEDKMALYGFLGSGIFKGGPENEEELIRGWFDGTFVEWEEKVKLIKSELTPLVNRKSPYEILWILMERIGVFNGLEKELSPHMAFIERLLEVTYEFELENGPSLSKYLEFWERGGLEEKVGLPENLCAVRVLTIHKAKGLEFPVVFIPFTDWRIGDLSPVEVYKNSLVHLTGELSPELMMLRFSLRAEEAQELLNLFYVAVTRAKEALYLFLSCTKGGGLKPVSFWIKSLVKNKDAIRCYMQQLTSE